MEEHEGMEWLGTLNVFPREILEYIFEFVGSDCVTIGRCERVCRGFSQIFRCITVKPQKVLPVEVLERRPHIREVRGAIGVSPKDLRRMGERLRSLQGTLCLYFREVVDGSRVWDLGDAHPLRKYLEKKRKNSKTRRPLDNLLRHSLETISARAVQGLATTVHMSETLKIHWDMQHDSQSTQGHSRCIMHIPVFYGDPRQQQDSPEILEAFRTFFHTVRITHLSYLQFVLYRETQRTWDDLAPSTSTTIIDLILDSPCAQTITFLGLPCDQPDLFTRRVSQRDVEFNVDAVGIFSFQSSRATLARVNLATLLDNIRLLPCHNNLRSIYGGYLMFTSLVSGHPESLDHPEKIVQDFPLVTRWQVLLCFSSRNGPIVPFHIQDPKSLETTLRSIIVTCNGRHGYDDYINTTAIMKSFTAFWLSHHKRLDLSLNYV